MKLFVCSAVHIDFMSDVELNSFTFLEAGVLCIVIFDLGADLLSPSFKAQISVR